MNRAAQAMVAAGRHLMARRVAGVPGITATEALRRLGYTHRRPAGTEPGHPAAAEHEVLDADGRTVAHLRARHVWPWLRHELEVA